MHKEELRKYLQELGYKFAVMLSSNKKEFYATREKKNSDGDFNDDSLWDCFKLENGDVWFKEGSKKPYDTIYKV